jgi:hypothetical protein
MPAIIKQSCSAHAAVGFREHCSRVAYQICPGARAGCLPSHRCAGVLGLSAGIPGAHVPVFYGKGTTGPSALRYIEWTASRSIAIQEPSMLSLFLSLLVGAFPLRGSVVQSIDSNLVLDGEILHATKTCTLGDCAECYYGFKEFQDTTKTSRLTGQGVVGRNGFVHVGWSDAGPSSYSNCKLSVDAVPDSLARFVFHGNRRWAVWADSIQYHTEPFQFMGMHTRIVAPVLVRWRWSAIDSTLPWVRWVDTIPLNGAKASVGLPLLTVTRPVTIESIAPKTRKLLGGNCVEGLSLAAKIDSTRSWNLSYGSDDCGSSPRYVRPSGTLPAGTTFRFQGGNVDVAGRSIWQLWSGTKTLDQFVLFRDPTAAVGPQVSFHASGMGNQVIDLVSGRRIRSDRSFPLGRQLLLEGGKLRWILVE